MESTMDIEMLTWEEFDGLKRYSNGRIMDLPLYYYRMTEDQINVLVGDDWSYYHELKEDEAYELSFMRKG
jgi:hypothetical protein